MSAGKVELAAESAFRFSGLLSYRHEEVALWNWCHRFLSGAADWRTWIQDAWRELLVVPAGSEITVSYSTLDGQGGPWKQVFKQHEIFIGREPDNDVVLRTLTAGKRHARIFVENSRCFLEDLGSSVGTYLNQNKLLPNQPQPVGIGDQIEIFPYTFSLQLRQLWAPDVNIGLYSAMSESMTWGEFLEFAPKGRTTFTIEIHPTGGALCLEANRAFLADLVERLLRPLELQEPRPLLGPADSGFLEFVIVALLERINRDLKFPFQFDTGACGSKPELPVQTQGVVLMCSLGLLSTTGALRVFAPYDVLEQMQRAALPNRDRSLGLPSSVAWKFPVSAGFQKLTVEEIAGLECDDVLLFEPRLELLIPGQFDRGWRLRESDLEPGAAALSNIQAVSIDKYSEREPLIGGDLQSDEAPRSSGGPDLNQLPLHLHVIVADKQLTLAEVNNLAAGTILQLDRANSGQVALAVNGKVLGEGQLVDIDGRLGVRILAWGGA